MQHNTIQMSAIIWLILFFSYQKLQFHKGRKPIAFFQNSTLFKNYKNISFDLSSIIVDEHQFYSPEAESGVG